MYPGIEPAHAFRLRGNAIVYTSDNGACYVKLAGAGVQKKQRQDERHKKGTPKSNAIRKEKEHCGKYQPRS
jgi:hypothetical protein